MSANMTLQTTHPNSLNAWPAKELTKHPARTRNIGVIFMNNHLKQLLLAMVFVGLLACFILQVHLNIIAFFDRRTTMSVSDIDTDQLEMPEISFCPGFRPGSFDHHIHRSRRDSKFGHVKHSLGQMTYFEFNDVDSAADEQQIDAWWRNITYSLEDFVSGVIVGNGLVSSPSASNSLSEVELTPTELLANNLSLPVAVKEISSPYGRCYELSSRVPFKATEFITVLFNLTEFHGKKLPVYIYEHGDIGLLGNYWVTQVFSLSLGPGETMDLPIIKEETSYLTNEKIPCAHQYEDIYDEDEDERQYHCILHWAMDMYKNMDCPTVCSVPQSFLYTSEMTPSVPPCLTRSDAGCAIDGLGKIYSQQDRMDVTGCDTACVRHSYRVTVRHEISSWDGVSSGHGAASMLTVFYPTSRVIRNVETRLLDNSAILSAIGGSLGLFLGFSFWECSRTMINKLEDFIQSRTKVRSIASRAASRCSRSPVKFRASPPPPKNAMKNDTAIIVKVGPHEQRLKPRPSMNDFTSNT